MASIGQIVNPTPGSDALSRARQRASLVPDCLVEAKRIAIQSAKNEMARVMQACEAESDKLDDVLEFFSLDVGASKYAPQEPGPVAPQGLNPAK